MKRHFETLATLMVCMTIALCVSCKKDGDHEYVDIGLPSGLLWATCNVGANSPEDDAAHVNWGGAYASDNYRIYGRSIRPVCPSQN